MDEIINWTNQNQSVLISIAAIVVGAFATKRFGNIIIRRLTRRSMMKSQLETKKEKEKREQTVNQILSSALHILVWPIALIMIISQLGVDIAPLLAGAGIVGLAVGFGAQSLVKDIISGLFIIIENQYGVGDVIEISGTSGVVEGINMRVTTMRDLDGIVHTIPNGLIEKTSNFTKVYSGVNLNIRVDYATDIEKAIKVINEIGENLSKEEEWSGKIIEPPHFLRVDNFAENGIEIKIIGDVQSLTQWEVMGEIRKRLKVAFDKAGIRFALPQRVVHQRDSKNN